MADGTVTSTIVLLIPVVVGGVIALAGGWLSQRLQAKAERQRRRAVKYEELIAALHEHNHWLTDTRADHLLRGKPDPGTTSPFYRVRAICSVYFPEFIEKVDRLEAAADTYDLWMISFHTSGNRQKYGEPDEVDQINARDGYLSRFLELVRALEAFARRELA